MTALPIIDLSRDALDFPLPPHVREAAKRALDEGATHYTTRPGLDPLRAAVAADLRDAHGITVHPQSEVVITCGTREALYVTLHVLLSPGDEVVIPNPSDPIFATLARDAGATVRIAPGDPDKEFALNPDALRHRVTRRTRALILPNPAVPAGTLLDRETLESVRDLAVEGNFVVVSVESYWPFVFDGTPRSLASLPGMAERTVTINGFSVPYSMAGWRVGYVAGPDSLIGPIMKLKQALSICSPAVSQYAALAALTGSQDSLREAAHVLEQRRDGACTALIQAGIRHVRPAAGPFILLDGSGSSLTGSALVRHLTHYTRVRLARGGAFGSVTSSWLRLTLSQPAERLVEAISRLTPVLDAYAQGGAA